MTAMFGTVRLSSASVDHQRCMAVHYQANRDTGFVRKVAPLKSGFNGWTSRLAFTPDPGGAGASTTTARYTHQTV
jgi:hypothetical protein